MKAFPIIVLDTNAASMLLNGILLRKMSFWLYIHCGVTHTKAAQHGPQLLHRNEVSCENKGVGS